MRTFNNTQPSFMSRGGSYGFTLVEIIIVIAIIAIIGVVSLANLARYKNQTNLTSATRQISALLREAQSRSSVQESERTWGVHFENSTNKAPFYALFYDTYSSSTIVEQYTLPNLVSYATSSVGLGSSIEVTFAQISGFPSASASITLNLMLGGVVTTSSIIGVSSSGLVEY